MSKSVLLQRGGTLLVALVATLAVAFAVCLSPATTQAQAADSLNASYSTKSGSFKTVSMGKTAGSTSSSAKALLAVKVSKKSKLSGSVSYSVYCKGKKYSASNGKAAGKKVAMQAMTVKLSKSLGKKYDVYYRVYVKGYGWLSWAKNGAKAGTSDKGKYVTAYQVKLVKKKGKAPSGTYTGGTYVNSAFFGLTGNLKADSIIATTAGSKSLNSCLSWVASNVVDSNGNVSNLKSTSNLKKAAIRAFNDKKGDCYNFTAAMYYLAKYKGYKVKAIDGQRGTCLTSAKYSLVDGYLVDSAGTAYNEDAYADGAVVEVQDPLLNRGYWVVDGAVPLRYSTYSWCEVVVNGQTLIYDPTYERTCKYLYKFASGSYKAYGMTYDYAAAHALSADPTVAPRTQAYRK
ncbi:MAG: hypothetical protein PUE49_05010 [Eggerthellales bacterium]|nr:hypothetical protein [Eggerthellales bacterium]